MIQVTVFRNRNEKYIGFDCKGHAGYANYGEDVICAGVSALVINTVNAISRYTQKQERCFYSFYIRQGTMQSFL